MRTIKFDVEDLEIIKNIFTGEDPLGTLESLGYVTEEKVEDNFEEYTFAMIYLAYRRRRHHKGLSLIKEGHSQWSLLCNVTKEAVEFIEQAELELRGGFVTYLEQAETLGFSTLRELRFKGTKITEVYTAEQAVINDPNALLTDRLVEAYTREILTRTGYAPVVKVATDYLPFMEASILALKYNLSPTQYIQGLAEKWEWAGSLQKHQLHGSKAEEYLRDLVDGGVIAPRNVKKVKLKKGADRY